MPTKKTVKIDKKKKRKPIDYRRGAKTVLREARSHKWTIVGVLLLNVIIAGLNAVTPLIYGKIIDQLTLKETFTFGSNGVILMGIVLIGAWVILNLFSDTIREIKQYTERVLGNALNFGYRVKVYNRFMRLPIGFFKNNKVGSVISKIKAGSRAIYRVVSNIILHQMPEFLAIVFALIITFFIAPQLGGLMVGLSIVFATFAGWRIRNEESIQKELEDERHRISGEHMDYLYNVPLVKDNTAEQKASGVIEENLLGNFFELHNKLYRYKMISSYGWNAIVTLGMGIIIGMGFMMAFRNVISVGEVVTVYLYSWRIFYPFINIFYQWESVQEGLVALNFAEDIRHKKTEQYDYTKDPREAIQGHIEFQNVIFRYEKDKSKALQKVSFSVEPGQSLALVGKSGSGKTTCVDLIKGAYFPGIGKVLIDGRSTRTRSLEHLRESMAVVSQDIDLLNDTVFENIRLGTEGASKQDVIEAARKAHALEFIENFPRKWKQVVGERGLKLSGGQKQRIAIARAILRDPKILILDEPTSALDAESEHYITKALDKLMKGRTTIIVAHRLSTVRKADKIVVLDNGKVKETGSHDELLKRKRGAYRKFYDLQIGLHK